MLPMLSRCDCSNPIGIGFLVQARITKKSVENYLESLNSGGTLSVDVVNLTGVQVFDNINTLIKLLAAGNQLEVNTGATATIRQHTA
mmetsp:Transcript_9930/g.13594  ORF Transcript_9930/g.13594 Transcript_9930/m.13594 type:complete len:87 (-) Transcript_9930:60-320(-)